MFKVGDVVGAVSDEVEAAGKKYRRYKLHVCVCVAPKIYFFINTAAKFADSFEITQKQFPALTKPVSYIGCGTPLYLKDSFFKNKGFQRKGALSKKILVGLIDHVNEAGALTDQEKELIIDALATAVGY